MTAAQNDPQPEESDLSWLELFLSAASTLSSIAVVLLALASIRSGLFPGAILALYGMGAIFVVVAAAWRSNRALLTTAGAVSLAVNLGLPFEMIIGTLGAG